MLEAMPAWHVPNEWGAISAALAPAIERDPQRDSWTVLDQAVSCDLDFWRVSGRGFVVTQTDGPAFWIIYVGGLGGSLEDKRAMMTELETIAREKGCTVVRFEGRDWRKVLPGYRANRTPDGRWHFRKGL